MQYIVCLAFFVHFEWKWNGAIFYENFALTGNVPCDRRRWRAPSGPLRNAPTPECSDERLAGSTGTGPAARCHLTPPAFRTRWQLATRRNSTWAMRTTDWAPISGDHHPNRRQLRRRATEVADDGRAD